MKKAIEKKAQEKVPTVFTNSELGKSLQRLWLNEFQPIIAKTYIEQNSDFVLVLPFENGMANIMFCKFSDVFEVDIEIGQKIKSYASRNMGAGKLIIVFMNLEGRMNCYTIKSN